MTTAFAVLLAAALRTQAPTTEAAVPIVQGAIHDRRAEDQLRQAAGAEVRSLLVYRIRGSMELMFRHYVGRFNASLGDPDTTGLKPGQTTPISYQFAVHAFDDECVDGTATECRGWRYGKDKRKTLEGLRVAYEWGRWVDWATFNWVCREASGAWVALRLELRDVGLSRNWKRYEPDVLLIVTGTVLKQEPQGPD